VDLLIFGCTQNKLKNFDLAFRTELTAAFYEVLENDPKILYNNIFTSIEDEMSKWQEKNVQTVQELNKLLNQAIQSQVKLPAIWHSDLKECKKSIKLLILEVKQFSKGNGATATTASTTTATTTSTTPTATTTTTASTTTASTTTATTTTTTTATTTTATTTTTTTASTTTATTTPIATTTVRTYTKVTIETETMETFVTPGGAQNT